MWNAVESRPSIRRNFTLLNGTSPLLGYSGGARFSYLGTPLDDGAQFAVSNGGFNRDFIISYQADGGNDVILTAVVVPEPGAAVSLLSGLGALIALRRRRSA